MEISVSGIEEAIGGLDYRSSKSPKSRLIRAIHSFYEKSESPDSVTSIDGDRLIDIMWNLGGDQRAIRSKRKNLNAIKSSVNKDLDAAWENGRNPEGVTIGPRNNFTMSDAAKEKILNSFTGSMNLDDGRSLDRVAEALKIVSEYISDMPEGIENEQLSNLKSLVEGLSEKFREGGGGEYELVKREEERPAGADVGNGPEVMDLETEADELSAEPETVLEEVEEDVESLEEEADDGENLAIEELEEDELVDTAETALEEFADEVDALEEAADDEEAVAVEELEDDELVDAAETELEELEDDELVDAEETGVEALADEVDVIEEEEDDEGDVAVEALAEDEPIDEEEDALAEVEDEADAIEEEADVEEVATDDLLDDEEEIFEETGAENEPGEAAESEFLEEGLEDDEIVEIVDGEEMDGETDDLYDMEDGDVLEALEEAVDDDGAQEESVELVGAEGLGDVDDVEIVYEDLLGDPADAMDDEGDGELDETEMAEEDVLYTEPEDEAELEEEIGATEAEDGEGVLGDDEEIIEDAALDEAVSTDLETALDEALEDVEIDGELDEIEPEAFDDMEGEDDFLEEVEEVPEEGTEVVELTGVEGLEDADEVEVVDGEDIVEEMDGELDEDDIDEMTDEAWEEAEGDPGEEMDEVEDFEEVAEGDEPEAGGLGDGIGLPFDQLMDSAQNLEEFQLDESQKRLLAEQFDGYLGVMERYYNQYILIKKGSYPVGAVKPGFDVMPEQKVLMADYYMGKYPVTNALFEVFVERTGYKTTAEKLGYGYVYHGRFRKVVDPNTGYTSSVWNPTATRERVTGATWYQPMGPGSTLHQKRNHPVVQVSVRDARSFAAWTGKRLPTEIEWEAAARTMAGNDRPWGDEWVEGVCNLENSGISDTSPVDDFQLGENEAGLADLLGNVLEWTGDECEPKYQMETPVKFFVAKGGAWISPEKTFLYDRMRFEADFTANILGFRCIAD